MTAAPAVPAGPPGRVVTLTANPSLDRTLTLPAPLRRGEVARLGSSSTEPGGKGVNVARAVAAAGAEVVCVFPAGSGDPFVGRLHALGLRLATVPVSAPVRTNYTLTEPDGTTTKLNEPGNLLDEAAREALARVLHERAVGAAWVALSGSLPPGTPDGWYADLVRSLRDTGAQVAVDTSEERLAALLAAGAEAAPDLLKPNLEELAQVTGVDEAAFVDDPAAVLAAVGRLHDHGVGQVLLTLGADGALLSTAEGVWTAQPPPITVRSTVGAGDSSLAGYILASLAGAPADERLRTAVAYGSASASLPGSAVPTPAQVDGSAVRVTAGPPGTPSRAAQPGVLNDTAPVPAPGRGVR
jgi:1-phosphofructokinase